jgi:hypothetical protein
MTHRRHRPDRNPAAQRSPAVAECAIWKHGRYWCSETARVHHGARRRGCVAAADAGAAAHDANGWRSGGAANRMRAWPCPMIMTRRKIIAQTMVGNETRPIKAKLRNASCLWDTHQRNLWVLDFIRRSPPRTWNIVQHDCGNVNDRIGTTVRRRNAGCP